MKWQNLIFLVLMMMPIVMADSGIIETYKPNEVFDLSIHLTNKTGDVSGANCTAEIRNSTYGVKDTIQLYEINGGYYNATYNTSKIGSYFCRTNCTKDTQFVAGACDFIIKGDQMVMGVIILIPIFITLFLLIIAWLLPQEKYPSLKIGLILASLVFIFQAYQYAVIALTSDTNLLIDSIGENTFIYTMVYYIIFAIILITFIYDVFMLFDSKKHKTGEYKDD